MQTFHRILLYIDYLAIFYFFIINATYLILNIFAFYSIRRSWFHQGVSDFETSLKTEFYKPLSIIVPAYNEQETIVDNIKSILALEYPVFEIVVVNDGSSDQTITRLKEYFNLLPSSRNSDSRLATEEILAVYESVRYPNLLVIDKKNGGKADALNAGVNMSQFPLVCNIDADSLIDNKALLKITEPFVNDWRVIAAGGTIRVANDCEIEDGQVKKVALSKKSIVRFQIVEYLRAFLFGRVGWAALNSLLIISGAFGVFKRKHLIKAGGYRSDTVGEDMELVLRMNRSMKKDNRKYRVVFLPNPVCWTQVPEDWETLAKQRRRWQRGLGQSLLMNKEMMFNPRYGLAGLAAFPFFFFVEFLGPIIEGIGYIALALTFILGIGGREIALLFILTAILMGILVSTFSLLFEELSFRKYKRSKDMIKLFLYGVLENFGYRQLHTFWRIQGIWDLIRKKGSWGTQNRKSFQQKI
ncbi:glycosyltransferase family 2 protein [Natronospora cellulosivora (SeqCode)]